jgi:hypothetical protein
MAGIRAKSRIAVAANLPGSAAYIKAGIGAAGPPIREPAA